MGEACRGAGGLRAGKRHISAAVCRAAVSPCGELPVTENDEAARAKKISLCADIARDGARSLRRMRRMAKHTA